MYHLDPPPPLFTISLSIVGSDLVVNLLGRYCLRLTLLIPLEAVRVARVLSHD